MPVIATKAQKGVMSMMCAPTMSGGCGGRDDGDEEKGSESGKDERNERCAERCASALNLRAKAPLLRKKKRVSAAH